MSIASAAFMPEDLVVFREVFEQAVEALPEDGRSPQAKSEVALRILAAGSDDERDPGELLKAALGTRPGRSL